MIDSSHPKSPSQAATSTPRPLAAQDRLAPTATAVLRGAAKGLAGEQGGFATAELWLLDDTTKSLRLAACWSRDGSSGNADRRRLTNAPADVAALAGGAVVLEQASETEAWSLHADRLEAAICLPVSSDTTVHGVMWLLSDESRSLTDETVELAEIVAGRLALEVERTADCGLRIAESNNAVPTPSVKPMGEPRPTEPKLTTDLIEAQSACHNPQSAITPPVEAAAWNAPHASGLAEAGCWELADERLLALSVAAIDSPESTEATQRVAVECLLSEAATIAPRVHDAGQLLTLLNRRLLESPLAGEGLAVAAALIDAPEDADAGLGGTGSWAFAGPATALNVRAAATASHVGDLIPLGWTEPQAAYAPRPFELAVRERLVLVAGDPRMTSPLIERRLGDVYRAATADAHREMTAEGCLRRLANAGIDEALAAVALRRD